MPSQLISAKTRRKNCFSMPSLFSVALQLGPIEIGAILLSGLGFLIMFGYSSATGGYQDLIKTTLDNDDARRKKNSSNNN